MEPSTQPGCADDGVAPATARAAMDCTVFSGCRIEISDSGDALMAFSLTNGRQWKKRVWPRMQYPEHLQRWNTNEEILSYFISFDRHQEWLTETVPHRPDSGAILFFDKTKTKNYRHDGYEWKTRTSTCKTIREDRMKLKVGGCQLLYGCYAHSASDSNFHRRTYRLLQNPNIVMVHYLDMSKYHTHSELNNQQVSITALDPSLVPTDWSFLTISDNNLCALLNMAVDADIVKLLLVQLATTLSSNVQPGDTLLDVVTKNNNGLPVDMYEDCRTKKPKPAATSTRRDSPCECECTCGGQNSTSSAGAQTLGPQTLGPLLGGGPGILTPDMPSPLATPTLSLTSPTVPSVTPTQPLTPFTAPFVASNLPTTTPIFSLSTSTLSSVTSTLSTTTPTFPTSGLSLTPPTTQSSPTTLRKDTLESLDALKVLSKSPHLIMSYHKEGSISYILTLPAAKDGGQKALPGPSGAQQLPGPRLLPKPSSSNGMTSPSTLRRLQPAPLPLASSAISDATLSSLGFMGQKKNNKAKKSQQQEKETTPDQRVSILDRLQRAISGLVRPSNPCPGTAGNKEDTSARKKSLSESISGENVEMSEVEFTQVNTPIPPSSLESSGAGLPPDTSAGGNFPGTSRDSRSSTISEYSDGVVDYDSSTSLTLAEGQSGENLQGMGGNFDPKLFEVPLSWLSIPNDSAHEAENNMEDVLNDPSTAASLYNSQHEPVSGDGVDAATLFGDGAQQVNTDDPSSVYNWDLARFGLDINSSSLDEMLKAQSLSGDLGGATNFQLPDLMESNSTVLENDPVKSRTCSQSGSSSTNVHAVSSSQSTPAIHQTPFSPLSGPISTAIAMEPSSLPWTGNWPSSTTNTSPHMSATLPASTTCSQSVDGTPSNSASHMAHLTTHISPSSHHHVHHHQHHQQQQHHDSSPMETNPTPYPDSSELPEELHSLIFNTPPAPAATASILNDSPTQLSTNQHDSIYHLTGLSSSPASQNIGPFVSQCSPSVLHQQPHYTSAPDTPSSTTPYDFLQQQAARKISNVSIFSEPPPSEDRLEMEGFALPGYNAGSSNFYLSLPNLSAGERSPLPTSQQFQASLIVPSAAADTSPILSNIPGHTVSQVPGFMPGNPPMPVTISHSPLQDIAGCLPGNPSMLAAHGSSISPSSFQDITGLLPGNPSTPATRSSISPSPLLDIPESIQIRLESALGENCLDFLKYRTTSVPSSPSCASAASSSMSMQEIYDDSPSVRELCEMLSESPNVQQADFSNMTLTDVEQDQVFHAAEIIQNAFRKYKSRRQLKNKEKNAALLIENYYKKYREAKVRRDAAARRIQNQYRIYKHRTKEVDRAATLIQQHMYRSKAMRGSHPYKRPLDPSEPGTSNK